MIVQSILSTIFGDYHNSLSAVDILTRLYRGKALEGFEHPA